MQRSVINVVLLWLMNNKLIYIAGPTCIGKTSLSIEIAKRLETEIISCDSRQFYKELKIGTSPPSREQLKEINHHFIHNKSIHDKYNVGMYEKDAINLINNLFKENEIIILVGGSGLYADSILYGIDDFPEIPSNIRNKIISEYESVEDEKKMLLISFSKGLNNRAKQVINKIIMSLTKFFLASI